MSRLPQIYENFKNKSTGQLAFITFFLNFGGGIARLITVLFETDDLFFQLQYVLGVSLSGTILLQFILYWNNATVAPESKGMKQALKQGTPG